MATGNRGGNGSGGRTSVSHDSVEGSGGPADEIRRVAQPVLALVAMLAVAFLMTYFVG